MLLLYEIEKLLDRIDAIMAMMNNFFMKINLHAYKNF